MSLGAPFDERYGDEFHLDASDLPGRRRTIDYDDGYSDGLKSGMGEWFLALLAGGLGGYVVRMVGEWLR